VCGNALRLLAEAALKRLAGRKAKGQTEGNAGWQIFRQADRKTDREKDGKEDIQMYGRQRDEQMYR
jgi:hypothetical protein